MNKKEQEQPDFLERVYASRGNEEQAANYDAWAQTYDEDTVKKRGRNDPQICADLFVRHVTPDAHVLDAGVGTGLVGVALAERGFTSLVGLDLSDGMIQEARSKGVYRELHKMVLGERLGFTDNLFDAVISVGVFTRAHAGPEAFDELVRVVRPGGVIAFALWADLYEELGFEAKQDELERNGSWRLIERSEPFVGSPNKPPSEMWAYEVAM
jgi:ubiquinone/menaquinone biosynthesis C-methylase UbiE